MTDAFNLCCYMYLAYLTVRKQVLLGSTWTFRRIMTFLIIASCKYSDINTLTYSPCVIMVYIGTLFQ